MPVQPYAPYAPPAPWRGSSQPDRTFALVGSVVVLVLVLVVGIVVMTSWPGMGMFGAFAVLPFLMVFFVVIFIVIAIAAGAASRPSLPPPPPIQQPMVPAGMEGPIALNCPDCGAPPASVDRFGVATCTHCGARFLVR